MTYKITYIILDVTSKDVIEIKIKIKNNWRFFVMKKFLVFAFVLTMALVFSVPAMAIPSYDSTVRVEVKPDDLAIVLNGDSVEVVFTVSITNISKSGTLPQLLVVPEGDNTEALAAAPITSIESGQTKEFSFTVTYTEVGSYSFNVWIRNMQGNSGKWNYEFRPFGVTVEIVEQKPEFPDGIGTDKDGNLIINSELLGGVLPQSNGQGWIEITVDGTVLRSGGQGGAQYNTNSKSIKIERAALADGVVEIKVATFNPNTEASLAFLLFMENGKPVGAAILDY